MRHFITPAIIIALAGGSSVALAAAETANPANTHPAAEPAAKATAINSICPVTGKTVDTTIAPVSVTTGTGKDATTVLIGVASKHAAGVLEKADSEAKALYVKAAQSGKMVEKGKVVDVPPAKPPTAH